MPYPRSANILLPSFLQSIPDLISYDDLAKSYTGSCTSFAKKGISFRSLYPNSVIHTVTHIKVIKLMKINAVPRFKIMQINTLPLPGMTQYPQINTLPFLTAPSERWHVLVKFDFSTGNQSKCYLTQQGVKPIFTRKHLSKKTPQ